MAVRDDRRRRRRSLPRASVVKRTSGVRLAREATERRGRVDQALRSILGVPAVARASLLVAEEPAGDPSRFRIGRFEGTRQRQALPAR